MRRSFDGLSNLTRHVLQGDPVSGHLFVFFNRTRHLVKVLWWDGGGFCIFAKRLERGRFRLPLEFPEGAAAIRMDPVDLALILDGIDLKEAKRRPRWEPAALTG
jgi:transposase